VFHAPHSQLSQTLCHTCKNAVRSIDAHTRDNKNAFSSVDTLTREISAYAGLQTAALWLVAGLVCCMTVVGIPYGQAPLSRIFPPPTPSLHCARPPLPPRTRLSAYHLTMPILRGFSLATSTLPQYRFQLLPDFGLRDVALRPTHHLHAW
jgi:hypothetical protein